MTTMDEEELQMLYQWVDDIPLSRPKRSIARDFSDGVLMAEVVKHYFPKLVDMHNYSATHSVSQKKYNWLTLDQKVFRKLSFGISKQDIEETKLQQIQEKKVRGLPLDDGGDSPGGAHVSPAEPMTRGRPPPVRLAAGATGGSAGRPVVQLTQQQLAQQQELTEAILREKDQTIAEMHETVDILDAKVRKLEQLVRLKDSKIAALTEILADNDINVRL